MCYDFEIQMLKKAYTEELARRNGEKQQAPKAPETTPAKPAATPVKDQEPVPV